MYAWKLPGSTGGALAMKAAVFELGFTLGSWPGSTGGALAMKTAGKLPGSTGGALAMCKSLIYFGPYLQPLTQMNVIAEISFSRVIGDRQSFAG